MKDMKMNDMDTNNMNTKTDRRKNEIRMYNLLLPLWLLLLWPSWLWLILIPLNYLIDRIVLKWGLGSMPDKGLFCRKHTWKVCLIGFCSDFAGGIIVLSVFLLAAPVTIHCHITPPPSLR